MGVDGISKNIQRRSIHGRQAAQALHPVGNWRFGLVNFRDLRKEAPPSHYGMPLPDP